MKYLLYLELMVPWLKTRKEVVKYTKIMRINILIAEIMLTILRLANFICHNTSVCAKRKLHCWPCLSCTDFSWFYVFLENHRLPMLYGYYLDGSSPSVDSVSLKKLKTCRWDKVVPSLFWKAGPPLGFSLQKRLYSKTCLGRPPLIAS